MSCWILIKIRQTKKELISVCIRGGQVAVEIVKAMAFAVDEIVQFLIELGLVSVGIFASDDCLNHVGDGWEVHSRLCAANFQRVSETRDACNAPTRVSVLMVAKNGALASTCQVEQSPIALSFDHQLDREHSKTAGIIAPRPHGTENVRARAKPSI